LPRTLKESDKVTYDQLEAIAQMALDDGAIMFNPKEADLKDVRAVLENAWAG
jgi:alcohol dehydrogenase